MCTHYFSDDMLWWYFKQEWKNNWDHSHFNQFQMTTSTVLIQQVLFSFSRYRSLACIFFDEQVPSLQIRITVLFSAALQTSRTALPGFPTTLLVFQNVPTHFFYTSAHSVDASFTRCRLNRRKLNTYRETGPPSWENLTWQVPCQLSHSANGYLSGIFNFQYNFRWKSLSRAQNGGHFENFEIVNTASIWPQIWKYRPKLCKKKFFSWW